MSRPKGIPKTGGRTRGTPNKRTANLLAVFDDFDYDPARALLCKYDNLSPSEQLKVDLRLMDFSYPKSKSKEDETLPLPVIPIGPPVPKDPVELREHTNHLKSLMYREDDRFALDDLKMILELRPEIFHKFISEMSLQSKVEKK